MLERLLLICRGCDTEKPGTRDDYPAFKIEHEGCGSVPYCSPPPPPGRRHG